MLSEHAVSTGDQISGMGNQQGGGLCSGFFGRMPAETTVTKAQLDQLVAMQKSMEQRMISYNETTNRKATEMTQELLNELKMETCQIQI